MGKTLSRIMCNNSQRECNRPRETNSRRECIRPKESISRRECIRPKESISRRECIRPKESISRRECIRPKESISPRECNRPREYNRRRGKAKQPNHPVIVWGVVYLSLASLTMIISSLVLFYCVAVIVKTLHWDVYLSLSLLTGILMLPTNCCQLLMISQGKKIDPFARMFHWDLWICMSTIIILSLAGATLCAYNMFYCRNNIKKAIIAGMKNYRLNPTYKHLMDVLQWGLKCCGLDSYMDWFNQDWYDSIRDYEWDTDSEAKQRLKRTEFVTDSVPLSCCKTGSCISNYLMEMGTSCIHLKGCEKCLYMTVITTLVVQLIMFISVLVVEVLIFYMAMSNINKINQKFQKISNTRSYDVKHLLNVNPNFDTSVSLVSASDDSAAEDSPEKAEREVVPDESSP